jgi:hypothetical protein
MDGVLCRREKGEQSKLVVPQSLIQDVVAENHDHIFVVHPGSERTFELISLRCWWLKMRQSIARYSDVVISATFGRANTNFEPR